MDLLTAVIAKRLCKEDNQADGETIRQAVTDYLDAHPELISGVEDGSITTEKLAGDVIEQMNKIHTHENKNILDEITISVRTLSNSEISELLKNIF